MREAPSRGSRANLAVRAVGAALPGLVALAALTGCGVFPFPDDSGDAPPEGSGAATRDRVVTAILDGDARTIRAAAPQTNAHDLRVLLAGCRDIDPKTHSIVDSSDTGPQVVSIALYGWSRHDGKTPRSCTFNLSWSQGAKAWSVSLTEDPNLSPTTPPAR